MDWHGLYRKWHGSFSVLDLLRRFFRLLLRPLFIALFLSLLAAAANLWLFSPPKTPVLTYVGNYEFPLQPNAWATEDVDRFRDLDGETIQLRFGNELSLTSLPGDIASLLNAQSVTGDWWWFRYQETPLVIYISMHGIAGSDLKGNDAESQGRAFLIPPGSIAKNDDMQTDDVSIWNLDNFLEVEELLSTISKSVGKSRNAIVVLDAMRARRHKRLQPTRFVKNRFLNALDQISIPSNVAVLSTDCGANSPAHGCSVFGRNFLLTLTGSENHPDTNQARTSRFFPRYLTLREVCQTLQRMNQDWSLANNYACAQPLFRKGGESFEQSPVAAAPATRLRRRIEKRLDNILASPAAISVSRLDELWADVGFLSRFRPWRYEPKQWARLEQELLRLEELALAGSAYRDQASVLSNRLGREIDAIRARFEALGDNRSPVRMAGLLANSTVLPNPGVLDGKLVSDPMYRLFGASRTHSEGISLREEQFRRLVDRYRPGLPLVRFREYQSGVDKMNSLAVNNVFGDPRVFEELTEKLQQLNESRRTIEDRVFYEVDQPELAEHESAAANEAKRELRQRSDSYAERDLILSRIGYRWSLASDETIANNTITLGSGESRDKLLEEIKSQPSASEVDSYAETTAIFYGLPYLENRSQIRTKLMDLSRNCFQRRVEKEISTSASSNRPMKWSDFVANCLTRLQVGEAGDRFAKNRLDVFDLPKDAPDALHLNELAKQLGKIVQFNAKEVEKDFWGPLGPSLDRKDSYYWAAQKSLLSVANHLHQNPPDDPPSEVADTPLSEFVTFTNSSRVPPKIDHLPDFEPINSDPIRVSFGVNAAGEHFSEKWVRTANGDIGNQLTSSGDESDDDATYFFRGHERSPRTVRLKPEGFVSRNVNAELLVPPRLHVRAITQQPKEVMLVLDASRSMGNENKLARAKEKLVELVSELRTHETKEIKVGVLAFGHRVGWSSDLPVQVLKNPLGTSENSQPETDYEFFGTFDLESIELDETIAAKVFPLNAWGQSPLYAAIQNAAQRCQKDMDSYIVVFSDLKQYVYRSKNEFDWAQLGQDRAEIFVVGDGIPTFNKEFLSAIGDKSQAGAENRQVLDSVKVIADRIATPTKAPKLKIAKNSIWNDFPVNMTQSRTAGTWRMRSENGSEHTIELHPGDDLRLVLVGDNLVNREPVPGVKDRTGRVGLELSRDQSQLTFFFNDSRLNSRPRFACAKLYIGNERLLIADGRFSHDRNYPTWTCVIPKGLPKRVELSCTYDPNIKGAFVPPDLKFDSGENGLTLVLKQPVNIGQLLLVDNPDSSSPVVHRLFDFQRGVSIQQIASGNLESEPIIVDPSFWESFKWSEDWLE